jgi:general secretion pathway protein G
MGFVVSCGTAKRGYDEEVLFSDEVRLKKDLSHIRGALSQYKIDHGHSPSTLSDLIVAGYLNDLPQDPITGKKDWVPDWSDCPPATNCQKSVKNIRSASTARSTNGTLYKDW